MKYEWSEDKRLANIAKHGRDFKDAHKVWESGSPTLDKYSERKGEERWQTTGSFPTARRPRTPGRKAPNQRTRRPRPLKQRLRRSA